MTIAETRANAKRNMWIFSLTQLILFKVWEFWFPRDENRFLAVSVPFVFLLVFAFFTFGWKYTEHHNASYTTECYDTCGMKFPKHLSGQTFNQSGNWSSIWYPVITKACAGLALVFPIFLLWEEGSALTVIAELMGATLMFMSEALDSSCGGEDLP